MKSKNGNFKLDNYSKVVLLCTVPDDLPTIFDLSIEKWEFVNKVNSQLNRRKPVNEGGSLTCSMCISFLDLPEYGSFRCLKCPIYQDTGEQYCGETPYEEYIEALLKFRKMVDLYPPPALMNAVIKAGERELTYLIELKKKYCK